MSSFAEQGLLPDCTGHGVMPVAEETLVACDGAGVAAGPDHHVLMQIGWGDHQVANFTAFDEARTIGAQSVGDSGGVSGSTTLGGGEALLAGRLCNTDASGKPTPNDPVDSRYNSSVAGEYCYQPASPLWGIAPISSYPYDGSAIAIFDAGPDGDGTAYATDPPPPSDVPPPDTRANLDPHEAPRRTCAAQDMKGIFFDVNDAIARNLGLGGRVFDVVQELSGGGTLAGPPYFSGGWQSACALP